MVRVKCGGARDSRPVLLWPWLAHRLQPVRVCWRVGLGSRFALARTAFVFSLKVAAGAGGLDAERFAIAGAGSIEIIHWTWTGDRDVILLRSDLGRTQKG